MRQLKSALIDNMASEMEKLRKENAELKSHLRVIRQSNSQGTFRMSISPPLEPSRHNASPQLESMPEETQAREAAEGIDLRLSEVFGDDKGVVREVHDEGEVAYKVYRPRAEASPMIEADSPSPQRDSPEAPPQFQLRSCFKGQRAVKNMQQHKKTMASRVVFHQ